MTFRIILRRIIFLFAKPFLTGLYYVVYQIMLHKSKNFQDFFDKTASSSVYILEDRIDETLMKETSYGSKRFNQDRP
jgi:hypothetical protein